MNYLLLTSHLSWLKIWLLPTGVESERNTRVRSMCSRPERVRSAGQSRAPCVAQQWSHRNRICRQAGYHGILTAWDSNWAIWLNFFKLIVILSRWTLPGLDQVKKDFIVGKGEGKGRRRWRGEREREWSGS